MKAKRLTKDGRGTARRLTALLMAVLMLVGLLPTAAVSAAEDDASGGFRLELFWQDGSTDYVYSATSNEKALVRLKISYENKQIGSGYAPGSVFITVPGLKGVVRSGTAYLPYSVAADKASDETLQHNWSYTYSSGTDTFTFYNNFNIEANTTFQGSFEIVWELPSRECVDGFEKILQAELTTQAGETTASGEVTYRQETVCDQYQLELLASLLSNTNGLTDALPEGKTAEDYAWVRYDVDASRVTLARGIDGRLRYELWLLDDAVVQYEPDDGKVGELTRTDRTKTETENGVENVYRCYTLEIESDGNPDWLDLEKIYAAYPIEKYGSFTDESNPILFDVFAELYGTYWEEDEEKMLAEGSVELGHREYEFERIPGHVYLVSKTMRGETADFIRRHCSRCASYGAIHARHLTDGKQSYQANFNVLINYSKNPEDECYTDWDSYDLELCDDIMDVQLLDGSYERLTDDEYHFTSVYIPSVNEIYNMERRLEADKYDVEIFVRYKNKTDFETTPINEPMKLKKSGQTVALPEDVVGVKICVYGIDCCFWTNNFQCEFVLHTENDQIRTDGGVLVNNFYCKIYGIKEGVERTWINPYTREQYSGDREYERDMELYGAALDRKKAELHILEVPSEFRVKKVSLREEESDKYAFRFIGDIDTMFTLGEGVELSDFSVYTVVPEGLRLNELYADGEALSEILSYASPDYTSAYLADHVEITVEEDWQGSGRQRVEFHFTLPKPICTDALSIYGLPMYVYKEDVKPESGTIDRSYTLYAGMLVHQDGKWYSHSFDNNSMEGGVWTDLDGDGDSAEYASFANSMVTVQKPEESELKLRKSIMTAKTHGYVEIDSEADAAHTNAGGTYSYRIRVSTDKSQAKNLVIADIIETADAKWQGAFDHVEWGDLAEQGIAGEPAVYYSAQEEDLAAGNGTIDLTSGGWTTEKPAVVRSIAIAFGDTLIPENSIVDVEIFMKAPDDSADAPYYLITRNESCVYYNVMDADGNFTEAKSLPSNAVTTKFVPYMGKIRLTKRDVDSEEQVPIAGAEFALYRQKGASPDLSADERIGVYTTDVNGRIIVDGLEFGNYYFKELTAPVGYEVSEELFAVDLNADNSVQGQDITLKYDFEEHRKTGEVTLKKVSDRNSELGLAGAVFSLYTADGTLVRSGLTTGSDGMLTVSDLEWGDYYLLETEAPRGYELSGEKIEFSVNAENDAGRELGTDGVLIVENEQKPASVHVVKHELLEDGTEGETPVAGAFYTLYDANGRSLGTYKTDENGRIALEGLAFGTYTLRETAAAEGYLLDTGDITLTVTAEHTDEAYAEANPVFVYDQRKTGTVWLQKLDKDGHAVQGAVYGLFDAATGKRLSVTNGTTGYVYDEASYLGTPSAGAFAELTTSAEGIVEISGLYWREYYIKEIEAPKGYTLDETEYKFTVGRTTVSETVKLNVKDDRIPGSVELEKRDPNDQPIKNNPATFTLYRSDGSVYLDDLETDENGVLRVDGLEWGSYYFKEKTAPAGYALSDEKVRFSVSGVTAGRVQYLAINDPEQSCNLTVYKKIKKSEIVFSHGNPTFTFEVKRLDGADAGRTYYKAVSFSETYVDTLTPDADGYVMAAVTFADLQEGSYSVAEVGTNRWQQVGEATLGAADGGNVSGTAASFELKDDMTATFVNTKNDQSETSHTALATNILKRARKLTMIVAEWNGPETVTTETLDTGCLRVVAVYDDGSEAELVYDETGAAGYMLNPDSFEAGIDREEVITVTYSENGITRTDTFTVNVSRASLFTANFVVPTTATTNAAGYRIVTKPEKYTDTDGTVYDGLVEISGYVGGSTVVAFPAEVIGHIATGSTTEDATYAGKHFKVVGICKTSEDRIIVDSNSYWGNGIDGMTNVTEISFAEGIEYIGNGAFMNLNNLNCELHFPSTLKAIGNCAFFHGTPTSTIKGDLYIPDSVTRIGHRAFTYNTGLTGTLHLPDNESFTSIMGNLVYGCTNLSGTLTIPNSVTDIGKGAFNNCGNLTGVLTIPDSVTKIGVSVGGDGGAFQNCTGLTGLVFGTGLQAIGAWTFRNDKGLKDDLSLPDSVTEIGQEAFYDCQNLDGELHIPASLKSVGNHAFYNCYALQSENGLRFPDSVTSIGTYAFGSCNKLSGTLTLPDNAEFTTIAEGAFNACSSLTGDLDIPDSVTVIGSQAFNNCTALDGVLTLPTGLTSIGSSAFAWCRNLTTDEATGLYIPDTVTAIGNRAFVCCNSLKGPLHLPDNAAFTQIEMNTFYECYNLTGTLAIPSSVQKIGFGAFYQCERFTALTIPNSVTGISVSLAGESYENCGAFHRCLGIVNDIIVPASVTEIGTNAFATWNTTPLLVLPTRFNGETFGFAGTVNYEDR